MQVPADLEKMKGRGPRRQNVHADIAMEPTSSADHLLFWQLSDRFTGRDCAPEYANIAAHFNTAYTLQVTQLA